MNLLAVALWLVWMSFDLQGFGQGQADSVKNNLVIINMITLSITVLVLLCYY